MERLGALGAAGGGGADNCLGGGAAWIGKR